jgi:hypothetical protein
LQQISEQASFPPLTFERQDESFVFLNLNLPKWASY